MGPDSAGPRCSSCYADAGLELVGIEDYPPLDRARTGAPGADEETEWFCEEIRNMGTLGIPMLCYNWMPGANWVRTSTIARGRGGALVTAFRSDALPADQPMKIGSPDDEQLWRAFERFIRAVVPVAEKAGVRLALHPDDPPIPRYRGASRIMISRRRLRPRARTRRLRGQRDVFLPGQHDARHR